MVSRCFPGGYNVKLYISRGRLAWWLLAFLCCDCWWESWYSWCKNLFFNPIVIKSVHIYIQEIKDVNLFLIYLFILQVWNANVKLFMYRTWSLTQQCKCCEISINGDEVLRQWAQYNVAGFGAIYSINPYPCGNKVSQESITYSTVSIDVSWYVDKNVNMAIIYTTRVKAFEILAFDAEKTISCLEWWSINKDICIRIWE